MSATHRLPVNIITMSVTVYPLQGHDQHWASGGVHKWSGQVMDKQGQTTIHPHIHTYGHFRMTN